MLLELLLEESELSVATLDFLQRTYNLQNQDAEVGPCTTQAKTNELMHSSSTISLIMKK